MKETFQRIILIVLDGVGVGALPDAILYGDEGSNTLLNSLKEVPIFDLPFFQKSGLGNILGNGFLESNPSPIAYWGTMREASWGKDTIIGHWEMMGIITEKPFPTYPQGFPREIIAEFEQRIGRKTLGNIAASGTEIIKQLGEEHMRTGYPIVYTSADSVFQIACHEEIVPIQTLYSFCQIARSMLKGEHAVLRVIARPFVGEPGNFARTANRKDFPLPPPYPTVLDLLSERGIRVFSFGKVDDVFGGRGITVSFHTGNNQDTMGALSKWLENEQPGFAFANLGDFDTLWGHRRLPEKFVRGLEEVDKFLEGFYRELQEDDLMIITADHGNDPTFRKHTDHTRERVPLLLYLKGKTGGPLGERKTFSDIGKTVLNLFGIQSQFPGENLVPF
ncbi:MAG: phosphopentomutase [Caldiserica bacterium]|jgi:phosphopentomutase|nr:phosphopentomutase [Caldisericota bacterium]MDH7562921.1 phosphopentomutase [Caldisericota bacterium]